MLVLLTKKATVDPLIGEVKTGLRTTFLPDPSAQPRKMKQSLDAR